MTTIAWRDGILAADSLSVVDGTKCRSRKLFRLDDGRVVAGAGALKNLIRFVDALKTGTPVVFDKEEADSVTVLVMNVDGSLVEYDHPLAPEPITQKFYAIGSGRQAAMAAMICGKSAVEAVEIAAEIDLHTGGEIQREAAG